jgi:hypothetical protein
MMHSGSATHRIRILLISGAMAAGCAGALGAQEGFMGTGGIKGTVRDSTGQSLIGVRVLLPGSTLMIETDDSGQFHLAKVRPGMLSLRFMRLGYSPDTIDLMILAGKTVPLEVTLARLALQLSPVVISGRAELTGWRRDFYQRREQGGGHFFTREDIDKRNPGHLTDMFRTIPGVTIRPSPGGVVQNQVRFRGARGCAPLTWLDGAPLSSGEFDLDALSPRSIEAVEVYPGSIVPARFAVGPGIGPRTCGAIVIWSREGQRAPPKRTSTVSPTAELASLVENRQIYTAAQVDVTARQDTTRPVRPLYPDPLLDAQIGGSVMVEFIVTPMGDVDSDRIGIVFASHPAFVDAVRHALATAVYVPATRGGYPVHQVVQHEFRFVPDSSRKR